MTQRVEKRTTWCTSCGREMRYEPEQEGKTESCPFCGQRFVLGELKSRPGQREGSSGMAELLWSLGVLFLGLMAAVLTLIRAIRGDLFLTTLGLMILAGVTVLGGVAVAMFATKTQMEYRKEQVRKGHAGPVAGLAFASLAGTLAIVGAIAGVLSAIIWVLI
ncbi:MAG: hypothetical protein ACLFUJ_11110 [Phycisphaerae bacterium]